MPRTCSLSLLVLALTVSVATPTVADTFLVYSQGGLAQPCDNGACYSQWCLEGEAFCEATERGCTWGCSTPDPVCDSPEGGTYQQHTALWNVEDGFIGWGVFSLDGNVDMTDFAGNLRFYTKVNPAVGNHRVKVEVECDPDPVTYPSGVSYVTYIADHGWQANTDWQEIVIPLVDASFPIALDLSLPTAANEFGFVIINPHLPMDNACLSAVRTFSKLTLEGVDLSTIVATMSTDFIRWEKPVPHDGASKVETAGYQLMVDDKPFIVNGLDYAPIAIGENWTAAWRDRADRYDVDFPLIAATGANAVRLYAPVLTTAMLDKAWAEGLYVIPNFGIDSINLECEEGKTYMQDRFVQMVNEWKNHPAILFWLIGNEVNLHLPVGVDLCGDWYPLLDSMAAAAEAAGSNHPVGTAVAGMTDICTSCSDDLDLPNVDLWAAQIYAGCTLGSTFNDYATKAGPCDRPLIISEFGVDAYHDDPPPAAGENQAEQAGCLQTLLDDAALNIATEGGVSSGQMIFSYADEWWKADNCQFTSWFTHDSCEQSLNPGFPDGKVHEEWFGIVSLNSGDATDRPERTAYNTVGDAWLGPVCNMQVDAFDAGTGDITIAFESASGNAQDHNLYYGPLNNVSTYGYTGTVSGLGPNGPSVVTLPAGDLFWVVAGENSAAAGSLEGCYGTDSAGAERPCFSGNCNVDQIEAWNCACIGP